MENKEPNEQIKKDLELLFDLLKSKYII